MPDDGIDGVVKHSSRLQPPISVHAPVIHTVRAAALIPIDLLTRRDEGSGKPCAVDRAL